MGLLRDSLPYDIDGVVYKVDSLKLQQQLGLCRASRAGRLRTKYPAQEQLTQVLGIEVQVGRTGKLTPAMEIQRQCSWAA